MKKKDTLENNTDGSRAKGIGRRGFIKSAAVATLSAGFVGASGAQKVIAYSGDARRGWHQSGKLQAHPIIRAPRGTERFWSKVRKTFNLPRNYIHMNTGTTGSQPLFSQNNLSVYNQYKTMDPRDWQDNLHEDFPELFPVAAGLFGESAMTARQEWIADMYGADPEEIVLSYNTTDACNITFAGTPWEEGDRIITTSFEHPALVGPINWARDYHGVEVRIVPIPSNFTDTYTVGDVLAMFESELMQPLGAGNKQYLAVSEIFYKNGLRLPIKELAALAKGYGAYTIIDTAHGWGMLPINCHEYGVDFIAGAGHKWLCGGPGTGIFYVRNSGDNLPPFNMGNWFLYGFAWFFPEPSIHYDNRNWAPSTFVQFRGESNTPALYAMTDSAAYYDYLDLNDIYERGVALGNYLKDKIAAMWGKEALWVQKNPDPRFATFLTSFNPFADKDDPDQYGAMRTAISEIINTLAAEDPKIYIRFTDWRDQVEDASNNRIGFRVSTHAVYNSYKEIDYMFERLVEAVDASGLPQLG
jgi:selenocysteine lyase/cysteine desulfurase